MPTPNAELSRRGAKSRGEEREGKEEQRYPRDFCAIREWEDRVIWGGEKRPVVYIGVCIGVRGKRRTAVFEVDGNSLSLSRAWACKYSGME